MNILNIEELPDGVLLFPIEKILKKNGYILDQTYQFLDGKYTIDIYKLIDIYEVRKKLYATVENKRKLKYYAFMQDIPIFNINNYPKYERNDV